ncbi:MAG: cytochrome P450 [Steroidobacteraceae bacterium]
MINETVAVRPDNVPPNLVVDFDVLNPPGGREDVHLAWKKLQQGPDIVWSPRHRGHWIVTRGEDIDFVQKNYDPFSMTEASFQKALLPEGASVHRLLPLEADPPEHTAYRAIVTPWFTPKFIGSLEKDVRALAVQMIESFQPKGECEFIGDFALQLPVAIFLRLTDLPAGDRLKLLEWTEYTTRGTPEQHMQGFLGMDEYIRKLVEARKAKPGSDLISSIVTASVSGRPITDDEIIAMCRVVLFGGLDTVASTMGFMAHFLATHPEHTKQLVDKPEIIPQAVDEMLRRFGVSATARVLTRDFEYKGVHFKKGDRVYVFGALYGLDDRKFERPLEVDFQRASTIHAGFGSGAHRCPGSFLARTELRAFLEEWLRRIPRFRIKAGAQVTFSPGQVNSVRYLPLVWDVAG